jgi:hypothetical protein
MEFIFSAMHQPRSTGSEQRISPRESQLSAGEAIEKDLETPGCHERVRQTSARDLPCHAA